MKRVGLAGFVPLLAVLVGCSDPLGPGTEWLAGSWRWVYTEYLGEWNDHRETAPAPNAFVLSLETNGTATIRQFDAIVLATRYRAQRLEVYGREVIAIGFNDEVRGELNYYAPPRQSNTLILEIPTGCHCVTRLRFVRTTP